MERVSAERAAGRWVIADTGRQVLVRVSADGKLDLAYGDQVLYTGLQLPNYTFVSNGKFGFYARTGGLNENQWIDNLRILAIKSVLPLRITQEPADTAVLTGKTASFTVAVSDPVGATYLWSKNNTSIPGATSASYTTPATTSADDGATLPLKSWLPDGKPKAVILALHGFNDYSNAFKDSGEEWAKHGIATFAYDQRGFGAAP